MKRLILIALLIAALLCSAVSAAGVVPEFEEGMISGIVMDGDALFATDLLHKVIWRVDESGTSVYAGDRTYKDIRGNVTASYFDGKLNEARFMEPWAIAPFYGGWAVTDASANVVRWFDDKTVETAAGSGKAELKDGFCLNASFSHPTGLAADEKGILYIADTGNGAIRRLNLDGIVDTILAELSEPTGLCWHDGALYVAETGRNRILKLTGNTAEVLAGGGEPDENGAYEGGFTDGPAAEARFEHPQGIAVADDGTVYIADTGNGAVRRLKDGRVSTLAATSDAMPQLSSPRGILVKDDNTVMVADTLSGALLEFGTEIPVYSDVSDNDWFAPAVKEALIRGILEAGSDTLEPNGTMTRAEFVGMLAKLQLAREGSTVIDGSYEFTDVTDETPYAAIARWSGDFGIITGTETGAFDGDAPIQRQQMVTILHRYVTLCGLDVSGSDDLSGFSDGASVLPYARTAMGWAVDRSIINGFPDGTLVPFAAATRAQAVKTIIYYMDMYGF